MNTIAKAQIFYHDIGDYLSREEKLVIVKKYGSISSIDWQELHPNEHGDWINQRNDAFGNFIPLAPEKKFDRIAQSFFSTLAIGVATNRDAWVYNFSMQTVEKDMQKMIAFYNEQKTAFAEEKKKKPELSIEDFVDTDVKKISWTVNLKKDASKNMVRKFDKKYLLGGLYRPFCKQNLYYDKHWLLTSISEEV